MTVPVIPILVGAGPASECQSVMRPLRGYLGLLGFFLFLGAWLNLAAFMLAGLALGGVNAKIEDGHYYLTDHAKRTEVSRRVFAYSRAHQRSVEITHPIGLFAGGGLIFFALRGRPHNQPLERTGPAV